MKVWGETREVLRRLTKAGFMVNIGKSKLLVSNLRMLGFDVDGKLMRPHYIRLEAAIKGAGA